MARELHIRKSNIIQAVDQGKLLRNEEYRSSIETTNAYIEPVDFNSIVEGGNNGALNGSFVVVCPIRLNTVIKVASLAILQHTATTVENGVVNLTLAIVQKLMREPRRESDANHYKLIRYLAGSDENSFAQVGYNTNPVTFNFVTTVIANNTKRVPARTLRELLVDDAAHNVAANVAPTEDELKRDEWYLAICKVSATSDATSFTATGPVSLWLQTTAPLLSAGLKPIPIPAAP